LECLEKKAKKGVSRWEVPFARPLVIRWSASVAAEAGGRPTASRAGNLFCRGDWDFSFSPWRFQYTIKSGLGAENAATGKIPVVRHFRRRPPGLSQPDAPCERTDIRAGRGNLTSEVGAFLARRRKGWSCQGGRASSVTSGKPQLRYLRMKRHSPGMFDQEGTGLLQCKLCHPALQMPAYLPQ